MTNGENQVSRCAKKKKKNTTKIEHSFSRKHTSSIVLLDVLFLRSVGSSQKRQRRNEDQEEVKDGRPGKGFGRPAQPRRSCHDGVRRSSVGKAERFAVLDQMKKEF